MLAVTRPLVKRVCYIGLNMLAAISGESLLWLFIWVIVAALIFWAGNWLIAYIGIPEPFNKVLKVILAVIAFVFIVNALLTLAGKPFINW